MSGRGIQSGDRVGWATRPRDMRPHRVPRRDTRACDTRHHPPSPNPPLGRGATIGGVHSLSPKPSGPLGNETRRPRLPPGWLTGLRTDSPRRTRPPRTGSDP
jgi:hypothetical protein